MTAPRVPPAQAEAFLGTLTAVSQRHGVVVDAANGSPLLVPIQPERWTLRAYVLGEDGRTFAPSYAPVTVPARLRRGTGETRTASAAPAIPGVPRWLLVVRRDQYGRQGMLGEAFALDDQVDVLLDRRMAERRVGFSPAEPDQRRRERRQPPAVPEATRWERVGVRIVATTPDDEALDRSSRTS